MSYSGVKNRGRDSSKRTGKEFSLVAWTIFSTLVIALLVFFFVAL